MLCRIRYQKKKKKVIWTTNYESLTHFKQFDKKMETRNIFIILVMNAPRNLLEVILKLQTCTNVLQVLNGFHMVFSYQLNSLKFGLCDVC